MTFTTLGVIDPDLADWNDRMYAAHPTPYERGIAGAIEAARVRAVLGLARIQPSDAVLEVGCESGRLLSRVPPARRVAGADISRRLPAPRGSRPIKLPSPIAEREPRARLPFNRQISLVVRDVVLVA